MSFGSWEVNIQTSKFPQKVATALAKFEEEPRFGAEYEGVAYLGSQTVNGTNHAVLAIQTILNGKDTQNYVLLIFQEKPGSEELSVPTIERVMEGGEALGGTKLNFQTEIPEEAQKAFDQGFAEFVGSAVKPKALLATKMTKGMNYAFLAELTPTAAAPATKAEIVFVNAMTKERAFFDLLNSKAQTALGYAFNW